MFFIESSQTENSFHWTLEQNASVQVVVESREFGQWPLKNNSHKVNCYLKPDRLEGKVAEVDDCSCVALPSTTVCHQINKHYTYDDRRYVNKYDITSELSHWFSDLLVVLLIDVQSQSVDSQPQVWALLVLDLKEVHAVHFQVLRDLQVLKHGLFPVQVKQTGGNMEEYTQISSVYDLIFYSIN